jgi:cytochrome c-type biogenesis protein CcmH/NrfG
LRRTRSKTARLFLILLIVGASASAGFAQGRSILYGDLHVEEVKAEGVRPASYTILLYTLSGFVISRQTIGSNGRYRIINIKDGEYDLVVEVENNEVGRIRVQVRSPVFKTDIRQDIYLEWKAINHVPAKPASITAEDYYTRSATNRKIFARAQQATDKKKYDESVVLLKQLLASDPNDFQAWTELGTVFLLQKNLAEAEKAYLQSMEVRPRFFLALMNLGRVRMMQQKFDEAIPILRRAVEVRARSADANYYLGEAYLQIKKGSKAVSYFYEALRLDPAGKADAHLRLAVLYNGAGLKDKAAIEYAEFLKKKPDYPNKKKLEQYIAQNKK